MREDECNNATTMRRMTYGILNPTEEMYSVTHQTIVIVRQVLPSILIRLKGNTLHDRRSSQNAANSSDTYLPVQLWITSVGLH